MSQNSLDFDTIIVGAGPAGLTAGMYAGRGMLKAIILESKVPGGELLNTGRSRTTPVSNRSSAGTSPRRWRPMR